MFFKRKKILNTPYTEMSLLDLLKQFIISKLPKQKTKVSEQQISPELKLPSEEITYIAIVLDGVVEDVMRAQSRLAALLLSNPEFVEFNPEKEKPQIGETKYSNGIFEYSKNQLMTDEEITVILNETE